MIIKPRGNPRGAFVGSQIFAQQQVFVGQVLKQYRHVSTTRPTLGNCSTEATVLDLDFPTSALRLLNNSGVGVQYAFESTTPGKNSSVIPHLGCLEFSFDVPITQVALRSTSTEAGGVKMDVVALGQLPVPKTASDTIRFTLSDIVEDLVGFPDT